MKWAAEVTGEETVNNFGFSLNEQFIFDGSVWMRVFPQCFWTAHGVIARVTLYPNTPYTYMHILQHLLLCTLCQMILF